jgi:hypothetical protein
VSPAAADRAVEVIEHALADEGPLTRLELRERIAAAGVPTAGQALVHLLMAACLRGIAVRGPMVERQHAYVLVRDWLGQQAAVERPRALGELARRYLAGHGPADDADLARWAGLPLRDARAGLKAIANQVVQRTDGLLELHGAPRPRTLPPPRLLGTFEPVVLGWCSRRFVVGEHEAAIINGGMFSAFAMVQGRAVARWGIRDGELWIDPFVEVSEEAQRQLARDGEAVSRYLLGAGKAGKV